MTDHVPALRIRQAVRALLLTPAHEILLVRFEFAAYTVWALPGGGLEPGESDIDALHRELIEEVGLTDPVIGSHVWTREHIIPFEDGMWDGQNERVYLVGAAQRFEPVPAFSWDQLHAERMHELRWWHLDEIEQATSGDVRFAPSTLAVRLRSLIDDGPPATPVDTGV